MKQADIDKGAELLDHGQQVDFETFLSSVIADDAERKRILLNVKETDWSMGRGKAIAIWRNLAKTVSTADRPLIPKQQLTMRETLLAQMIYASWVAAGTGSFTNAQFDDIFRKCINLATSFTARAECAGIVLY